jgi:TRAP-type C4-dicarboxylate transport system substrate-binding protein
VDAGLLDICKNVSVWQIMPARSSGLLANAGAFDALPADLKKALLDTSAEISREQFYAAHPEMEAFMKWITSTKIQVVYPSNAEVKQAQQLTSTVVNNWLKTAGPYGQQVLDISAKYIAQK